MWLFGKKSESKINFALYYLADFLSNGKLTQSLSSIRSSQCGSKGPSLRPKSAWVGRKSKQAWASAPRSSPTDSRDSFESSSRNQSKPSTKVKVIDGSCLESKDQTSSSSSFQEDGCVLCETGVTLCKGSIPAWSTSERRNSNPARLWSGRKKGYGKRTTEDGAKDRMKGEGIVEPPTVANVPKQVQQMVLQQYHLRIMGKAYVLNPLLPYICVCAGIVCKVTCLATLEKHLLPGIWISVSSVWLSATVEPQKPQKSALLTSLARGNATCWILGYIEVLVLLIRETYVCEMLTRYLGRGTS